MFEPDLGISNHPLRIKYSLANPQWHSSYRATYRGKSYFGVKIRYTLGNLEL